MDWIVKYRSAWHEQRQTFRQSHKEAAAPVNARTTGTVS
jgi:hypothetical protein